MLVSSSEAPLPKGADVQDEQRLSGGHQTAIHARVQTLSGAEA
jgi:hypothetical protein